jgi:hypothetical protein
MTKAKAPAKAPAPVPALAGQTPAPPQRKKPGRKPIAYDSDLGKQIYSLRSMGVSADVLAAKMGISKMSLYKHYKEDMDKGFADLKIALHKTAFRQAATGNSAVLIFLLKILAGLSTVEKIDHVSSDGTMTPPSQVSLGVGLLNDTEKLCKAMNWDAIRKNGKKD